MNTLIIVDNREKISGIPFQLEELGLRLNYRNLTVGDYLLSRNYAVERKSARDFISALYSGRLFDQAQRLSEVYQRPLIIIEGLTSETLEELHNPKSFWGAVAHLSIVFNTQMLTSPDRYHTALLIAALSKQLAKRREHPPIVKMRSRLATKSETQLAVAASLPGIGSKLAERLLRRFHTIRAIINAPIGQLATVEGLGKIKAHRIHELLEAIFEDKIKSTGNQAFIDEMKP